MDHLFTHFGTRLKNERVRLNLTQKELAKKMDVQPLTIVQYEKGNTSPTVDFIYSLQRVGFDISYLILDNQTITNTTEQNAILLKHLAKTLTLLESQLDCKFTNEQKTKIIYSALRQSNSDNLSSITTKTLITYLINQIDL